MVKFKIMCDPSITEAVRKDLEKNVKDLQALSRKWSRGKVLNRALRAARMPSLLTWLKYEQHDNTFYCEMRVTGDTILGDKETFKRIEKTFKKDFGDKITIHLMSNE